VNGTGTTTDEKTAKKAAARHLLASLQARKSLQILLTLSFTNTIVIDAQCQPLPVPEPIQLSPKMIQAKANAANHANTMNLIM
jgi:hypothetical protein